MNEQRMACGGCGHIFAGYGNVCPKCGSAVIHPTKGPLPIEVPQHVEHPPESVVYTSTATTDDDDEDDSDTDSISPTQTKSGCGCGWIIALAIFVLWLTNPSYEKHQKKFVQHYNERHPIAKFFTAPGLVATMARYNNYLLFSTTTLQDESVTFGVLGIVVTTAKGL